MGRENKRKGWRRQEGRKVGRQEGWDVIQANALVQLKLALSW